MHILPLFQHVLFLQMVNFLYLTVQQKTNCLFGKRLLECLDWETVKQNVQNRTQLRQKILHGLINQGKSNYCGQVIVVFDYGLMVWNQRLWFKLMYNFYISIG